MERRTEEIVVSPELKAIELSYPNLEEFILSGLSSIIEIAALLGA